MGSPISTLPARSRPRERLLAEGREALSDAELLALQLRSGTGGASANDLAANLLAEFGGLRRLSSATVDELARVPGIGTAKAAGIVAAFELARRLPLDAELPIALARASDVAGLAQRSLAGLRRDRALVFVCDRHSRLLREVRLSEGTANRALVDVREVLNAVLRHDGAAFALAYNHPSGDLQPSEADMRTTHDVAAAAKTVGLRFLGHAVVADDAWAEVELRPNRRRPD